MNGKEWVDYFFNTQELLRKDLKKYSEAQNKAEGGGITLFIPKGTKIIRSGECSKRLDISRVVIPNSVKGIAPGAFY